MSDLDSDLAGIFSAIDTESTAHEPVETVSTEAVAEGAESTTAETETKTEETNTQSSEEQKTEEVNTEVTSETAETVKTETTETTESDTLKTETQTETVDDSWRETLPPRPADYSGPTPEIDPETGTITNMDPAQYQTYVQETTLARFKQEQHDNFVMNASLEQAEKLLPEMKTNPAVRNLVQNSVTASILAGEQIDSFEAAKQVREALGLAPERIAQAKAEGAQSAKTHIEVQKIAAVETSSTQTSSDTDKVADLQKRIRRGDDEAMAELLSVWEDDGII